MNSKRPFCYIKKMNINKCMMWKMKENCLVIVEEILFEKWKKVKVIKSLEVACVSYVEENEGKKKLLE